MNATQTENLKTLVIVDPAYDFSREIEEDLFRRFSKEADVHLITEADYAVEYFHTPREIDVLVVDTIDPERDLSAHEIGRTLAADEEGEALIAAISTALFPVEETEGEGAPIDLRDTKVITVTSPVGGCGKSLAAYALARKLRKLDQTVLLIGCDETQSIAAFLPSEEFADKTLAGALKEPGEETHWSILQSVERDEIDYLRPFEKDLLAMGIGGEQWGVLIDVLKEKQDFDFLVLDLGPTIAAGARAIFDRTDVLLLLTEENEIASRKLARLQKNPDHLPRCECILVANEYRSDGLRLAPETIFGTIAPYETWTEALEDPVFYRIALKITE